MVEQEELIALLTEKRDLFLACEEATDAMCVCPIEALEQYAAQRQKTLDDACALDTRIETLLAGDAAAQAAMRNVSPRQGLAPQLGALYDASMRVKAVASRILQNEDTVRGRIELEKKKLLEKIEGINTGGAATAARYGKSVSLGVNEPVLPRRDKMI